MHQRRPLQWFHCAPLALAAASASCSTPGPAPAAEHTPTTDVAAALSASASAVDQTSSPIALVSAPTTAPAASTPTPVAPPATAAASAPTTLPGSDTVPTVKVVNIGMHIGGGPNDDVTKEPIRRSVQPHFDELRRCFTLAEDPKKGGDFGVDLRIPKDGGRAQVTEPRTAIKGDGFKKCVVGVFEQIEFLKPRGGLTVVSYSLRFTP